MKQMLHGFRLLLVALALVAPSSLLAAPTCYQTTNFALYDVQPLQAVSCTATPAGYGWYWVDNAPNDLRLALRLDLGLDGCSYMSYEGQAGGVPVVRHLLILGIDCENEPFPLTTAPPVATTPTTPVAGARVWLRADAGITLDLGRVSQWADQSGFGNHAAMSTASRRPTMAYGVLNGQPTVRFAGAQSLALTTPTSPQTFTIFVVGKNSRTTESFSMILGPGGSTVNNQLRWENGSSALVVGTGNNLPATTAVIGNTRVYHALAVRYNGSTLQIFRDGNLVSSRSLTTTGPWTLFQIAGWYSSHFLIGDLSEILIYHSALSDADRATNDAYLRGKYGLP